MPNLGDYLGHLVSEVTIARMQADLEVARIAEIYAGHPLLKHMPVPRFRLPTVNIDVPVLIQDMDEAEDEQEPRGHIYEHPGTRQLHHLLDTQLEKENIRLTPAESVELKKTIKESANRLWSEPIKPVQRSVIARVIQQDVGEKLRQMRAKEIEDDPKELERTQRFERRVYEAVHLKMMGQLNTPPRLRVRVGSQEMRSLDADQTLARFQLSISEEAYEWTVVEDGEQTHQRLVME